MTADAQTRFQKAQLLQQWFREDGDFRYDQAQVESAGSGGADLLAFLDDRVGYCEQFAASMAIMARVLGIPSRVAVGFLEPEKSTNGAWVFSAHDLHAWPELYFPGSGWVRFEPTPAGPGRQRSPTTPPPTSRPSPRHRRRARAESSELLPERGASPSADAGSADEDTSSIPWVPILAGLLGLAVVALLLLTPRLVRAARRRRRLAGDIEDLWVELRDVARDLGHAWPVGRSPRRAGEWLGRLLAPPVAGSERADRPRRGRDQAPEAAAALDRLVRALEHSRYSREPETFTAERFAGEARARRGGTGRRRHPPRGPPRDLVARLRRGTAYVLAPPPDARGPDPDARSTPRPAGRSTSSSADRALPRAAAGRPGSSSR